MPLSSSSIVIALAFDFINGFHDAANSIATVVSTRVLSPQHAVYWAAFFNFVAAFFVGTPVAKTIGTGIIDPVIIDTEVRPVARSSAPSSGTSSPGGWAFPAARRTP